MRSDLTLTGVLPGLLRRGSPTDRGTVVALDRGKASVVALVDFMELTVNGVWIVPCAALTLDLTDPTGRYHALLWLRERGHELRWADDEPEVLAWSVLSVARGGRPLSGLLPMWAPESRDDSDWDETRVWIACVGPDGWSLAFVGTAGPETGDLGRAAADRAALAAGYALRNDDGLVLPELPKENA